MVAPALGAAAISGGAALLGGVMQQNAAVGASTKGRHFAREMFKKQVELANTAHQREVKDLRAAGLNPILSARGSGASVPSSMGYQPPQFRNIGADVAHSAATTSQAASAVQLQQTQGILNESNTEKAYQEVKNLTSTQKMTDQQTRNLAAVWQHIQLQMEQTIALTENTMNSSKLITEQTKREQLENIPREIWNKFLSENEMYVLLERAGITGAAAKGGVSALKNLINKWWMRR